MSLHGNTLRDIFILFTFLIIIIVVFFAHVIKVSGGGGVIARQVNV